MRVHVPHSHGGTHSCCTGRQLAEDASITGAEQASGIGVVTLMQTTGSTFSLVWGRRKLT